LNIQKTARGLSARSFAYTASNEWTLREKFPAEWNEFTRSWDRLVVDQYMKEGDTYRERRFCKYLVDAASMSFVGLEDFFFFQDISVNRYAGNLLREFAPVEAHIRKGRILQAIIARCLESILVCLDSSETRWRVYVHQFRINCNRALTGRPTPEGLHRDGHDFISMHLISRVNVVGGASIICDRDGRSLTNATLTNPLDGFVINDRSVLHGVTPITSEDGYPGHRDMLIIDYNREEYNEDRNN
jgi:hypothetical protein